MHDTNNHLSEHLAVWSETRIEYLLRTRQAMPRFLQGVYPFVGSGVFELNLLHNELTYEVPHQYSAQVVYFRAGNLSDDLLYLALTADGRPVRYFPVGPKSDFHVPLAIVESYSAHTCLQICLSAPRGLTGSIVVDMGIVEEMQEEKQQEGRQQAGKQKDTAKRKEWDSPSAQRRGVDSQRSTRNISTPEVE